VASAARLAGFIRRRCVARGTYGPRVGPGNSSPECSGNFGSAGERADDSLCVGARLVRDSARLEYLLEFTLRQVLNFVEFLTWRTTEQCEPLLSVAGSLSGKMLSAVEIEQELYGERKEHSAAKPQIAK